MVGPTPSPVPRRALFRVAVAGDSMAPALLHGDWLLCRALRERGAGVRVGDVVVVEHPLRPGFLLVKRAIRLTDDGWWIEGDNGAASDDSRLFGPVAEGRVLARAVARLIPHPRMLRARGA
jgi:nickel-type superoxide dismutase maturation protease